MLISIIHACWQRKFLAMINFSLKTTTSTPFKLTGMWPHITFHHYILPGIDKMRERRASLAGTF